MLQVKVDVKGIVRDTKEIVIKYQGKDGIVEKVKEKEFITEVNGFVAIPSINATERELKLIGTKRPCLCCGKDFVIGEREIHLARHEYKGRNINPIEKTVLEIWEVSNLIVEVDLTKNPIDFKKYTMQEQAVILAVSGVNTRICKDCFNKNQSEDDKEFTVSQGRKTSIPDED
jgi:hypothetical protein